MPSFISLWQVCDRANVRIWSRVLSEQEVRLAHQLPSLPSSVPDASRRSGATWQRNKLIHPTIWRQRSSSAPPHHLRPQVPLRLRQPLWYEPNLSSLSCFSCFTPIHSNLQLLDSSPNGNHLEVRADPPQFVYSTAPLTLADGRPVRKAAPGSSGYSLALNDQQVGEEQLPCWHSITHKRSVRQVLIRTGFTDFPSTAVTLEFWMMSVDGCRQGVSEV